MADKTELPLCACGCGERVTKSRNKYASHSCAQRASRATTSKLVAAASDRLDGSESQEQRMERENTELRNELRKTSEIIRRFEGRSSMEDRLIEEVVEFIQRNPYRPTLIKPIKKKATAGDHEMMLLLSDAHFPEVVSPDEAMGLSYGPDICRKRMQHITDTVVRYKQLRESAYPVRKLTVACLGDMLAGNIHEEIEITNAFPISEALVQMGYMLHDMGLAFSSEFEQVEMIVMPGNHSRLKKKPTAKMKWDNWEFPMGHLVKALASGRFDVVVPRSLVYRHKIFDLTIGMTHGDGVKSNSFAGIPFYGLKQRRDAMQALLKQLGQTQLDHLVLGHFHSFLTQEATGCTVTINGSIKGGDEYSIGTMYTANEPVQVLGTFHAKHGLTDWSRINLGHVI